MKNVVVMTGPSGMGISTINEALKRVMPEGKLVSTVHDPGICNVCGDHSACDKCQQFIRKEK